MYSRLLVHKGQDSIFCYSKNDHEYPLYTRAGCIHPVRISFHVVPATLNRRSSRERRAVYAARVRVFYDASDTLAFAISKGPERSYIAAFAGLYGHVSTFTH